MDDLFGVSMTAIMLVLLAMLAVALVSIAVVAWRNQIMFKLGVRNIPRRRAQTTLIVLGLMLSTVIISAAFTTGDTVDRSITNEVYSLLGSVDEVVLAGVFENDDDAFNGDDPSQAAVRDQSFGQDTIAPLIQTMRSDPNVDAVVPSYADLAVAINPDKRLSSPQFYLQGLDAAAMGDLPDLRNVKGGGRLHVEDLGPGEIYVDESAAEELDVAVGEAMVLYVKDRATTFRVKAIAEDRRLAGAGGFSVRREGGVLPLATVQSMFDAPGRLTQVYVSNKGDARAGATYSSDVEKTLDAALIALPQTPGAPALAVVPLKRVGVDIANQGANFLASFFLALGLFSIAAGVMLIFMIFVMLAAERKPEMGMARAVGTKRADLVQTFLSEGMAYNVLAALVGTGLGVVVAFGISQVMARIFREFDISIAPHVTFRSLAISYSLGVVLTFLTVTFSSWRVSQINIVRAIRDIPEPPPQRPEWRSRGFFRTLLGLVFRPGLLRSTGRKLGPFPVWRPSYAWIGLLIAGIVLQGAAGSATNGAIQALLGVLGGICLIGFLFMTFRVGFVLLVVGLGTLAIFIAADSSSAFVLLFGLSLVPLGLALILRTLGANERAVYTACGVLLIYIWELDFTVGLLERVFGESDGGPEMFFLSGVMVTIAATFIVVYNADLILAPLTRLGRGLGALLPSIKMAVAYPLASRTRTGLTMAMFCLVVFALTMMSSMNHNFNRLFISDRALGGWDVYVDENPSNPIGDLQARLRETGSPASAAIEAVGSTSFVAQRNARLCQVITESSCPPADLRAFEQYTIRGDDESFLTNSRIALQARAPGYESDADVWRAIASDPSLAIIDAFTLPGGGFGGGGGFVLDGVEANDKQIDPVTISVMDASTRKTATVKVIGIIELGSSASYNGLHVSNQTLTGVFGAPDAHRYYARTVEGANNRQVAHEIESALLTTGAQAESLRYEVDKQNATFSGFFYLMQGFMGLGLFVGVAAVGVIAFRTVVERRQQIGMLRALGYTRRMIGLTFLIESAFISFMGVLSGIVFALILARQLITDEFANQGGTGFVVPWPQVLVIASLAFGFAMLMTLIPSRQAARIPIAAALRYE